MARLIDLTATRFGRLTVVSLVPRTSKSNTRWLCRCDCGTEKTIDRANLLHKTQPIRSCGCLKRDLLTKPDDEITYNSAHSRIVRSRGRASEYPCVCGCGRQSDDWALMHEAKRRRQDMTPGRDYGKWLSPDPMDYQPMARICHKPYDIALRREAGV